MKLAVACRSEAYNLPILVDRLGQQQIQIELTVKQKGLRVQTRNGYYARA